MELRILKIDLFLYLIAGSRSQAIAEVLPATNIEKKTDKIILSKNFLE